MISYKAIKLETKDIVYFKHGNHTFLNCNKLKNCFKLVFRFILSNEVVKSESYSMRSYTVMYLYFTHMSILTVMLCKIIRRTMLGESGTNRKE